ncbi:MAG: ATP synthase F0 subunit B [Lachnospiraceae bacterium]|nr:ATP synthase F0 subunit B [Lachnospiraceae bacterium]
MPLNIDFQQIFLHMFNFLLLFGGLYFILYKPVKDFMDKREKHFEELEKEVQDKLSNAKASELEYNEKLKQADEEIRSKKQEALNEAQKIADTNIERSKSEAEKILAKAKKAADAEHDRIIEDAQREIEELAMETTKKIIASSGSAAYDEFLSATDTEGSR